MVLIPPTNHMNFPLQHLLLITKLVYCSCSNVLLNGSLPPPIKPPPQGPHPILRPNLMCRFPIILLIDGGVDTPTAYPFITTAMTQISLPYSIVTMCTVSSITSVKRLCLIWHNMFRWPYIILISITFKILTFISFYLDTANQVNCHGIMSHLIIVSIQYTYGLIPVYQCGYTMIFVRIQDKWSHHKASI